MANNQIAYVELPTSDIAAMRIFYADLFGWTFFNLGDDYAVFQNAGIDGGINPNKNDRTKSPLVLIESDDAEGMQERVRAAGSISRWRSSTIPAANASIFWTQAAMRWVSSRRSRKPRLHSSAPNAKKEA